MDIALTPHHGLTRAARSGSDGAAGSVAAAAPRAEGTRARTAGSRTPRPVGVEAAGAFAAAVLLWALQLLPYAALETVLSSGRGDGFAERFATALRDIRFLESPVWVVAPAAVLVALFAVRQLKPRPIEGQLFLLPVLAIVVYGVAGEIAMNVLDPGASAAGPLFITLTTLLGTPIMVLLVAIAYTMWSTAPRRADRLHRQTAEA